MNGLYIEYWIRYDLWNITAFCSVLFRSLARCDLLQKFASLSLFSDGVLFTSSVASPLQSLLSPSSPFFLSISSHYFFPFFLFSPTHTHTFLSQHTSIDLDLFRLSNTLCSWEACMCVLLSKWLPLSFMLQAITATHHTSFPHFSPPIFLLRHCLGITVLSLPVSDYWEWLLGEYRSMPIFPTYALSYF